ncbi:MAG: hypothetical protein LBN26_05375 [Christensenellaceae bacterium]|nr:hypothetical protein [Christensenellaceae bacterium]
MENMAQIENHMLSALHLERHYGGAALEISGEAAYEATERRLYRVPILRERVGDDKEELAELENGEVELLQFRYSPTGPFGRGGAHTSPQELHADQMAHLRARLAANERELRKLQTALSCISGDAYYPAVELRYFQSMREADIALRLMCDPATVRRNRMRLVKRLAVRLYGVEG